MLMKFLVFISTIAPIMFLPFKLIKAIFFPTGPLETPGHLDTCISSTPNSFNNYIGSEAQPHACEFCNRKFKRKDSLKRHYNVHLDVSEKKLFLCEIPGCNQRYSWIDNLYRHQMMTHGISRTSVPKQHVFPDI